MKKFVCVTAAGVLCSLSTHAQWVVFDPALQTQSILNSAQEIAKFVEVVNNQVQQIQSLANQLNEFKHYEDLFGDPKSVALSMVSALTTDLRKTEPGKNLEDLLKSADGAYALTYDASGIYHAVGEIFTTPGGQKITRPADEYRSYAAVNRAADNYVSAASDAASRRTMLKNQIAQTTEQLKTATTDAEVQKLNGVLLGLSADLASADHEVNQALASALVQDIQNRNEEQKRQQARQEQQQAEFHEATANYNAKFQLLAAPVQFPKP